MNTKEKKLQAIADMRLVARNPLRALRLLNAIKNNKRPTEPFAGFLLYYLHFINKDIKAITTINLFKKRSSRCDVVITHIKDIYRQGIIDDTQCRLLACATRLINKLIKRYFLIYLFL